MTDLLRQSIPKDVGVSDDVHDTMTSVAGGTTEAEQQLHLVEHGVHIATTASILLLVALCLFLLIRFFLKPVSAQGLLKTFHVRAPTRSTRARVPGEGGGGQAHGSREMDTFLVIPDISGYTQFMKLNRFTAGHAQYVVSELLNAMIDAANSVLRPASIGGDSVLFYAVSDRDEPRGGATGNQVGLAIIDILNSFYQKRTELRHDNACPCEVCRHIDELNIKVVVHRGPAVRYALKDLEDVVGLPVIAAHRLLKNSLGMDRYILVTEEAANDIALPLEPLKQRYVERYDDVGEISFRVYGFQPSILFDDEGADQQGPVAGRMRDAVRKLAQNARALGRRGVAPSSEQAAE